MLLGSTFSYWNCMIQLQSHRRALHIVLDLAGNACVKGR